MVEWRHEITGREFKCSIAIFRNAQVTLKALLAQPRLVRLPVLQDFRRWPIIRTRIGQTNFPVLVGLSCD